MGIFEMIFLFVSFCLISIVMELAKEFLKVKLLKKTIQQSVDVLFTSLFKATLKYKLEKKNLERGGNDEVSNL